MDSTQIKSRIKQTAQSTDTLIVRLDTLTSRIDTARANENAELVEYYEKQFAEVSAEFMTGVENILDDWYALRGEARPPADRENLDPEMLENIHETVVEIVQGLSADFTAAGGIPGEAPSDVAPGAPQSGRATNRVDLTG